LWDSPWGRIGFCICYDLSYRRVTDRLVELGAQAIIVPTADEISWGERQHRLHTRVAPVRAAEYAVPIFRVAGSGISQSVDARGQVLATAPYPGQGETIDARLQLGAPGHLPLDHWLAPLSVLVTAAIILWFSGEKFLGRFSRL
jgi:apolipoprotein N-acyltransferase